MSGKTMDECFAEALERGRAEDDLEVVAQIWLDADHRNERRLDDASLERVLKRWLAARGVGRADGGT
jgi:hypothetical protein